MLALASDDRPADVLVAFFTSEKSLATEFPGLKTQLALNGGLWIAWPKKASGIQADLDEQRVRAIGLAGGLVDNKVCAISDVWSGLRFVYRRQDRGSLPVN